jgi:hypothetical protein
MAITAGELIKRLQTYPEDQLIDIVGGYDGTGQLTLEITSTSVLPPVVFDSVYEDRWERGPNGDEVGRRSEEVRDESER